MVDQDLRFRKSSRSEANGHCVELAPIAAGTAFRDSKNAEGPTLRFEGAALRPLLEKIKAGSQTFPG